MKQLDYYLQQFKEAEEHIDLYNYFSDLKKKFDFNAGGNASDAFEDFVEGYNWFGNNKKNYNVSQNAARNFVGALMQDWLAHLMYDVIAPYPELRLFSEVRVRFGYYPVWKEGEVEIASPSELSDLCIGYLMKDPEFTEMADISEHKQTDLILKLPKDTCIMPLVTVNAKIRISQGEFFDWQGRETLMTKGNPHCLSTQVALRKEMDINIVEASQAHDKWFLLGEGSETSVKPRRSQMERLLEVVTEHLEDKMEPNK